jgi:anti-anti-sigma factor
MLSQLLSPYVEEATAEEVTVVHFNGDKVSLDEATSHDIRDQLVALAEEPNPEQLLLDFGNVEYISSQALGLLVHLHRERLAAGRRLAILNLRPQVQEVFAVTRLDTLLDLRPAQPETEPTLEWGRSDAAAGVLVVDDEEAVRAVLVVWLHRAGFQVWSAAHGVEAIELFRRHRDAIAVVLLDVLMPGLDGPQTLLAIQRIAPSVRSCFMTGNPDTYTEEALLRLGAARIFQKPFAFPEVLDTLRQLASPESRRRRDRWIEIPVQKECE